VHSQAPRKTICLRLKKILLGQSKQVACRLKAHPNHEVLETGLEGGEASGSSSIVEGKSAEFQSIEPPVTEPQRPSAEAAVTLSHDRVARALAAAGQDWGSAPDRSRLRRMLLDLLRFLDDS
jgi:hypothetical protein